MFSVATSMLRAVCAAAFVFAAQTADASSVALTPSGSSVFGPDDAYTMMQVNVRNAGQTTYGSFVVPAGALYLNSRTENFLAWSVSISASFSAGLDYIANDTTPASSFSDAQWGNLRRLFQTSYSGLNFSDGAMVAGFQIAMWEVLFETSGTFVASYDDGSSLYFGDGGGAPQTLAALTYANTFLDRLNDPQTGSYELTAWTPATTPTTNAPSSCTIAPCGQILVSAPTPTTPTTPTGSEPTGKKPTSLPQSEAPLAPVPLPAGIGLLAFAVASLFGLKRRKTA